MADSMTKYDPSSGLTYHQWYRKYSPKFLAQVEKRREQNREYARERRKDPDEKAKDDAARQKYQKTEKYKAAQKRWYIKGGKEYARKKYRQDREKILARRRDRYKNDPEYRAKEKAKRRKYYDAHKKEVIAKANAHAKKVRAERGEWAWHRDQARAAVNRAKYAGKIVEKPCAHRRLSPCDGRLEAHHYLGYKEENWLDIVWLCHRHHMIEEYNPTGEFYEETVSVPWEKAPPVPDGWRICSKCGTAKPKLEYYQDPRRRDGLYSKCKSCHNKVTIASGKKRKARLEAQKAQEEAALIAADPQTNLDDAA